MRLNTEVRMRRPRLELMDYKNLERQAEETMKQAILQQELARMMYKEAVKNIKKRGGLTNIEEDEQQRKRIENCDTTSV